MPARLLCVRSRPCVARFPSRGRLDITHAFAHPSSPARSVTLYSDGVVVINGEHVFGDV